MDHSGLGGIHVGAEVYGPDFGERTSGPLSLRGTLLEETKRARMAQIGILHGNKESFPQAVMEALNRHQRGCCRFLCVDALHQLDHTLWGWDTPIILDLFSGQMPFLQEAVHLLALDGDRTILNCPKLARLHNRATVRRIAGQAGLRIPCSILLPARSTGPKFPEQGYVNLRFPLAWEEILRAAGPYPHLQALDFDREPGVTVEDLGALWRRYNETGTVPQELVHAPQSEHVYRVYAIGTARFVRPLDPLTHHLMPAGGVSPSQTNTLIAAADAILAKVPWAISALDLGLQGQDVEYLDANPDPYLEWWVLGEADFARAVDGALAVLKPLLKASESKKTRKKKGNG